MQLTQLATRSWSHLFSSLSYGYVWISTLCWCYKYNTTPIKSAVPKSVLLLHQQLHYRTVHFHPIQTFIYISSVSRLDHIMGIRLPFMGLHAKQIFKSTSQHVHSGNQSHVPKGHIAVYVGELQKKRFVVPISYLNHPAFLDLLNRAEEEFGFNHPMGALTIPCKEDAFISLTSQLRASWTHTINVLLSVITDFIFSVSIFPPTFLGFSF